MTYITQLRLLFEEHINVMSIAEELLVFSKENYLEEMKKRNFATVVLKSDGVLWKYDKEDDFPKPIPKEDILPAHTPLLEVFQLLLKKRRYFIKKKNKVAYIVTRSDLDKIPIRLGFFGLISVFETYLKELVRKFIPNWKESLSKERVSAAEKLYKLKLSREEEIDLVQCLHFADLKSIFSKNKRFKKFDPSLSRGKYDEVMRDIGQLRDVLAHSQQTLCFTWSEINDLIVFIRNILDQEQLYFEEEDLDFQ